MNEKSIFDEIRNLAWLDIRKATEKINDMKEEIIIAFIAKYGIDPEKVVICEILPHSVEKDGQTVMQGGAWLITSNDMPEKYQKLLNFVTCLSRSNQHFLFNDSESISNEQLAKMADIILKEIGELKE